MPRIFLCYRRKESAGVAGRIYDRLRARFGDDAVFMDIDSIPFGEDFREQIDTAVGQCHVVLAIIGAKWAWKTKTQRRLDDPRDFVRIELESALNRNLPVIPVLIDDARMPGEADLPPSLARLAFRNAIKLDQGRDFHHHVDRLMRGIDFHFQKLDSATAKPTRESNTRPAEPESPPPLPVEKLTNSAGVMLIHIEAGEFLMGTTKGQVDQLGRMFPDSRREYFDAEQPQHFVKIMRPFFLGIHEVTQRQYKAVMGENPSIFKGLDNLPVENVSWLDAIGFCNKLSERENRAPFYRINGTKVTVVSGNGYRLPTEAEWEYACRAKSTTLYPFGDDAGKLNEHAWYASNAEGRTHPVGQKLPNAWGLYDMLGNVWEWCADWYDEKYYAWSPPDDPPGAAKASHRVFRGGSWRNLPRNCRPAGRSGFTPGRRDSLLGFRVAAVKE
jgi:formylglycine-generating enzyme required for sulfatase activity